MKSALRPIHVLFFLFEICVFGDRVKVEIVSVIEGDSVTLHTNVAEIQKDDVIEWRLNGNRIAKISGDPSRSDGVFRDGLKLDKRTGDIKITNIKTTDSGEYILKITSTVSSEKTFSVSGIPVDGIQSVMEGDSVTLHTDVTDTQRYDVIKWRFEHNSTICEINRKDKIFSKYENVLNGRFRDRLKLGHETGDLTITKTITEHTGIYEVDITSSGSYTIHKSFTVIVSGKKSVSVIKGDSVTLHTDTELQADDKIMWIFKSSHTAETKKTEQQLLTNDDVSDESFKDRLELDQTGSLTIMNIRTEDAGNYTVKIIGSRRTIHKIITVTVTEPFPMAVGILFVVVSCVVVIVTGLIFYKKKKELELEYSLIAPQTEVESLSVEIQGSVTLNTGVTGIKNNDVILWDFAKYQIAKITKGEIKWQDVGESFSNTFNLDYQTGSLIISNATMKHGGLYELKLMKDDDILFKLFKVTVCVNNPENVPLNSVETSPDSRL